MTIMSLFVFLNFQPELKRKHEEALELLERTVWKRFHGCIHFIGEIFKLKVIDW